MAAEIGKWPVEPTSFYLFLYYPTNALAEEPTYTSLLFQTYSDVLQAAKDYITAQANVGVCVIQNFPCTIVYPYLEWQDNS